MFRFFRKHGWILIVVIVLTILSFLLFMGNAGTRNRGSGGGAVDLGSLYGRPVTPLDYDQAQKDFELYFFLQNSRWPDRASVSELDVAKQTYVNLLFDAKARAMGISVSSDTAVKAAANILDNPALNRALGNRSGKPISMTEFVDQILKPHGLTAEDFAHFVRSQMVREQLQMTLGLSGAFVTPQEASAAYDREHQTMSTEAMFFSASNYLGKVMATPAEVQQYYTNYMADYRYPDRVQVNYVYFDLTNYLAQAKAEWAKTNFEEMVTNVYKHQMESDPSIFGNAKTPEAAMQYVRDSLVKQRAYVDIGQEARDFVSTLFAMTPVQLDNFKTAAKEKHLTVHLSEPFSEEGSEEFADVSDMGKTAFALNADSPFSDAIPGAAGVYVIGLVTNLPSSVPAFDEIKARVTKDFELLQATTMARTAGTNFWISAAVQAAAGKSLEQIASDRGLSAVKVAPFSLSSQDVPEIGEHVDLQTYKAVAYHTFPGHMSPLLDSRDGNFLLYVKSISPPDAVAKAAELPQFSTQIRRQRENEAFSIWVNNEASKELANVPALQKALQPNR